MNETKCITGNSRSPPLGFKVYFWEVWELREPAHRLLMWLWIATDSHNFHRQQIRPSCLSVIANERLLCRWMGRQRARCQDHAPSHTRTRSHTHGALVAKVSAFSRQNKGVWKGLGNCRRMWISVYTVELTWRQLLRAQFKSTTGRPCVRWAQLIVRV